MSESDLDLEDNDFASVVSRESGFDEDELEDDNDDDDTEDDFDYSFTNEKFYESVPTTFLGEENRIDGHVSEYFRHHRATHFYDYTRATQSANGWLSSLATGWCAVGTSGLLNVAMGIAALLPWISMSFLNSSPERCVPNFEVWLLNFGIVALFCPALHAVFAKMSASFDAEDIHRGHNHKRPFCYWMMLFGGPAVVAFNWVFNLGWAITACRVFFRNRFYDDPTLSQYCQREHDIGWSIIVFILSSITFLVLCTCVFSFRFAEILIRNAYRRRQIPRPVRLEAR